MRRLLALLLLVPGCAGPAAGTLHVQVGDQPDAVAEFRSLVVHLDGLRIHSTQGAERDVAVQVASVDIVPLQGGNLTSLTRQAVPTGNYTWIKMNVTRVDAVLANGSAAVVETPVDRLKLNGPFEVRAGAETTLTIDVRIAKDRDGYKLTPVLGRIR